MSIKIKNNKEAQVIKQKTRIEEENRAILKLEVGKIRINNIDFGKMTEIKDGVLLIKLPKAKEYMPKKVEIKE